jgi:predicted PurR-regulated permease PerM
MKHRRPVFLGVSAAVAVAVMVAAHEVMLPFVLAIVIAYVLTPLVALAERRKLPPALAVLLVYAVVLGGTAGFLRAVTPRIAVEFRNLRGELPGLATEAKTKWVPAVTDRMRALGLAPPEPVKDEASAEPAPTSAFVARPQPDGTIAIDVGTGANVVETKSGWAIEARPEHHGEPFDPNRVIADVVGKSFAYAQENSLEIARAVRNLVAGISRVVFVFFITLMLAAYIMLTRERIVGFFRSLVKPSASA